MIKRRKTIEVKVGGIKIGRGNPILVQSMAKTPASDIGRTVKEIKALEKAGCEIIRVAVRDAGDAKAIRKIKGRIRIPLVADIHFDYRLALAAIDSGADKIRINPGNITDIKGLKAIAASAKKRRIPIRIGVNSGSVQIGRKTKDDGRKTMDEKLVAAALQCIKLFESMDFRDIIISLKASDVATTVEAYRELAGRCSYPMHLGITASGLPREATIKSAIGVGALLLDGIGDTIRVSLTGSPLEEVSVGRGILSALGLRNFGPEIISCPTCGRCQVDLVKIVKTFEQALLRATSDERVRSVAKPPRRGRATKPVRIAIMGCEVNGPGEAREADIGIAAGKGCGVLFKKGKIIRRISEKDFVSELLKEM